MASLTYTATDEYGNDITVRLPDWTGHLLLATTATPPDGTLVADGSTVSRSAYHELFKKIGTTYGAGDGVTTFTLPDWRDEFPRFSGSARAVGTKQGDAIREILGSMNGVFMWHGATTSDAFTNRQSLETYHFQNGEGNTVEGHWINFAAGNSVPTADENRPRNIAFLPCIIYV